MTKAALRPFLSLGSQIHPLGSRIPAIELPDIESLQNLLPQSAPLTAPSHFLKLPRHELTALLQKQTPLLAPAEITPSIFPAHLAGEALLQSVHEFTQQGHDSKSYRDAQRAIFSTIDRVIINGVTGVYCAYSEIFVPGEFEKGSDFDEEGDLNGDGHVDRDGMNVEHLWAQSYFEKHLPMRSDVHHLLATFMHPNGMRGRLPFGNIADDDDGIRYRTSAGAKATSTHFEPPDSAKGDVARAMFYFFARYHDQGILPQNVWQDFWHNSIATLMEWNRQHPPDAWEIQRNQRIQAFQGNLNPFVLDPQLIDRIGASAFHFLASRQK